MSWFEKTNAGQNSPTRNWVDLKLDELGSFMAASLLYCRPP